jgi:hypothetical protein
LALVLEGRPQPTSSKTAAGRQAAGCVQALGDYERISLRDSSDDLLGIAADQLDHCAGMLTPSRNDFIRARHR